MNTKLQNLVDKAFPKKDYRNQQKEATYRVADSFNKGKRFIALEAPTGIGKSPIAITMTRLYTENASIVITPTKILQRQYTDDPDYRCRLLVGAGNYFCGCHNTTCDHGKRLNSNGKYCPGCAFKRSLDLVSNRNDKTPVVTNVETAWHHQALLASIGSPLLIVDEAHNLEKRLSGLVDVVIKEDMWSKVTSTFPNRGEEMEWAHSIAKQLSEFGKQLADDIRKASRGSSKERSKQTKELMQLSIDMENAGTTLCSSMKNSETRWIAQSDIRKKEVRVQPVFGGAFANKILELGDRVLFMSATFPPKDMFCKDLRIDPMSMEMIRIEQSPFPKERRPIVYYPVGSMSKDNREATLPEVAKVVQSLAAEFPNSRGVVHLSSKTDCIRLGQMMPGLRNRLIIQNVKTTGRELLKMLQQNSIGIVISACWAEGVDLAYRLARFNIIAKVPFADLSDKRILVRMKTKNGWYDGEAWYRGDAAVKVCQMAGRTTRAPDDCSLTVILDQSWGKLYRSIQKDLPPAFLESYSFGPRKYIEALENIKRFVEEDDFSHEEEEKEALEEAELEVPV